MTQSRRHFLSIAAAAPFAALGATRALAEATACYDPAALSMAQKSMRKSFGFALVSTDPAKRCDLCAFYKSTAPGCGTCQILSGPVSSGSICTSFAAKPK